MAIRRFDGANWIDCSSVKRFDGANWVDCSSAKRWDGANWIECMMTRQYFIENISHLRSYHYTYNVSIESRAGYSDDSYRQYYAKPNNPYSSVTARIKFKAVMKNGTEYDLNRELIAKLNCRLYLNVTGKIFRGTSSSALVSYCGLDFSDSGSFGQGIYFPEGEDSYIFVSASSATVSQSATVTIDYIRIQFYESNENKTFLEFRTNFNNGIRW